MQSGRSRPSAHDPPQFGPSGSPRTRRWRHSGPCDTQVAWSHIVCDPCAAQRRAPPSSGSEDGGARMWPDIAGAIGPRLVYRLQDRSVTALIHHERGANPHRTGLHGTRYGRSMTR